jgi:hypothetical protein
MGLGVSWQRFTQEVIDAYAALSEDDIPLHVDLAAAKRSEFGAIDALTSLLGTPGLPPEARVVVRLRHPARPGDAISAQLGEARAVVNGGWVELSDEPGNGLGTAGDQRVRHHQSRRGGYAHLQWFVGRGGGEIGPVTNSAGSDRLVSGSTGAAGR